MAQENKDKIKIKKNFQYLTYNFEHTKNDGIPGPAEEKENPKAGAQALLDWNRLKTIYFINEKSVDEIKSQKDFNGYEGTIVSGEKPKNFTENQLFLYKENDLFYARFNGKVKCLLKEEWDKIATLSREGASNSEIISACGAFPFKSIDELPEFFEAHLFCKVKDEKKRKDLAKEALRHFHQAGFPMATNLLLSKAINTELNAKDMGGMDGVFIPPSEATITYIPTKDGVSIKETNVYKEIRKDGEWLKVGDSGYHLKAITDKEFKITDDGLTTFHEMKNISIHCDCSDPLLLEILNKIEAESLLEKQSELINGKLIKQLDLLDFHNQLLRVYKEVDDEQIKASMVVVMNALAIMNNPTCSEDAQNLLKKVVYNTNLLLKTKPTAPEYEGITNGYSELLIQVKEESEKNPQSGFWKQLGGSMLMLLGVAIIVAAIVFAVLVLPAAIAAAATIATIAGVSVSTTAVVSVGCGTTAAVGAYIAYKGGFFAKKGEEESIKSKGLEDLSKSMEEVKENFRPKN